MTHHWWTYTYDPVAREVTVLQWTQSGNLRAKIVERYEQLTWAEACDVLECASWELVERLR